MYKNIGRKFTTIIHTCVFLVKAMYKIPFFSFLVVFFLMKTGRSTTYLIDAQPILSIVPYMEKLENLKLGNKGIFNFSTHKQKSNSLLKLLREVFIK